MRKSAEQDDASLENLKALYVDMVQECGLFLPILRNYIELLRKDAALLTPYEVYEAGKRAATEGTDETTALFTYLRKVTNRPQTQLLNTALQDGYTMLGRITGLKGLVEEFVHEHRRLYGPSASLPFFEIGYQVADNELNSERTCQ